MEPHIVLRNTIDPSWLMEHAFTDSARRFLDDAFHRCLDRGIYGELPPLSILWAMLRWERKVAVVVLEQCGIDLVALERDVGGELSNHSFRHWRHGIDCGPIRRIAEAAVMESDGVGHSYVGCEHLLLALCTDQDHAVRRIFRKHKIVRDDFLKVTIQFLNG